MIRETGNVRSEGTRWEVKGITDIYSRNMDSSNSRLGRHSYRALVDTGAEVSVILRRVPQPKPEI